MTVEAAVATASAALAGEADPVKASGMQAYMKTTMPFYGVQKRARTAIACRLVDQFAPSDHGEYEDLVLGLWNLPHREEKYLALHCARAFRRFVTPESLTLYRRLIAEGAWWDLVDEVATHLVRDLIVGHPDETWPEVDAWAGADDMWLRRSALICQVGAKERTDERRLFSFCERLAAEHEFFIRKAIGWGLRDYARTAPRAVAEFVTTHRRELSGLSFREATKHIGDLVT